MLFAGPNSFGTNLVTNPHISLGWDQTAAFGFFVVDCTIEAPVVEAVVDVVFAELATETEKLELT